MFIDAFISLVLIAPGQALFSFFFCKKKKCDRVDILIGKEPGCNPVVYDVGGSSPSLLNKEFCLLVVNVLKRQNKSVSDGRRTRI